MTRTSSSDARWRLAAPADDASVIALSRRLYEEDPSAEPVPEDSTSRTLEALRAEPLRGRALVLADDRAVLGYALLVSFWSNELGGETCEIDELYVVPEERSRGHASALLRALHAGGDLWPRRPVALALQATRDNERAQALYRRLGFRPSSNQLLVWRRGREPA